MKTQEAQTAKLPLKTITKAALLVALLCASVYISIPLPGTQVVFTPQTMIINMIAILLTPAESFVAMVVYTLMGLIGLPVFSGATGGIGRLFGPTGGYIVGFLIATPAMSWTKRYAQRAAGRLIKERTTAQIVAHAVNGAVIGTTVIDMLGAVGMMLVTKCSFAAAFGMAVAPFLALDYVKCVFAALLAVPVMRALERLR